MDNVVVPLAFFSLSRKTISIKGDDILNQISKPLQCCQVGILCGKVIVVNIFFVIIEIFKQNLYLFCIILYTFDQAVFALHVPSCQQVSSF